MQQRTAVKDVALGRVVVIKMPLHKELSRSCMQNEQQSEQYARNNR